MISFAFPRTTAIALTWTADRQCQGVRVRRAGERFAVERIWSASFGEGQSLGDTLAEGVRALAADEACSVIVGPATPCCCCTDLTMPRLPPDELRKALAFELGRQSPLPAEKLVWGYRLLPETRRRQGKALVRLYGLREAEWQKLLDELGSMEFGVDAILPPEVALDPLLSEKPLFLPSGNGHGFLFAPAAKGGREIVLVPAPPTGVLGDPAVAPILLNVALGGELDSREPVAQQAFLPALLLALYGLGSALHHDRTTGLPVPGELRVRRNRAGRFVAMLLAVYLLAILAAATVQRYQAGSRQFQALRAETQRLRAQISDFRGRGETDDFLQNLETEFKDAKFEKPPLALCLLEVTQRVGVDTWVQNFSWNDGKIDLELTTTNENLDVIPKLEASPFLSEVVSAGKIRGPNDIWTVRLQMVAAYEAVTTPEPEPEKPPVLLPSLPPPPPPGPSSVPPTVPEPATVPAVESVPLMPPPPPPPPPLPTPPSAAPEPTEGKP